MKKILSLLFFATISLIAFSQKGSQFPAISGETTDGKVINLPAGVKGKYSIVGLAFSPKAQKDLESWAQPMFTNFIEKSQGGLFDDSYDVYCYMLGVFSGVNQAGYEPAKKQAKTNVDKDLLPNLLFTKNEPAGFREALSIKEKDTPYFFLLDENGKILHVVSGAYSEKKMQEILKFLDEE